VGFFVIFLLLKPIPVPDHRKLLLISVLVLTALFFIEHFFLHDQYFFLPDDLPDFISNKPISIGSLFLVLSFLGEYYFVFKRILKQDDTISIWYLIVFGALIALFSEVIYQFYLQFTFSDIANSDRVWTFFKGVLVFTVLGSIMAFSIAYDLKYKNRWISNLVFIGLFVIFNYTFPYIKDFLSS
jgi:hypothetical protein